MNWFRIVVVGEPDTTWPEYFVEAPNIGMATPELEGEIHSIRQASEAEIGRIERTIYHDDVEKLKKLVSSLEKQVVGLLRERDVG